MKERMIIIGAGAAGLTAALELAKNKIPTLLVSDMPSNRAQSVMAEGGINAAVNQDKESIQLHIEDTMKAGRYLADERAVSNMCINAPEIIQELYNKGMAFTLDDDKKLAVRAFGGQSVKRTYFASSNTGQQLMYVLIDRVREYEAKGIIERLTGWVFLRLLYKDNQALGCVLYNSMTNATKEVYGKVLVMSGGLNGMFGNATGSLSNTGAITANLFVSGVTTANLEFIQYHPTTVKLHEKNMLITEAVRGEGGRLFVLEEDKPVYFMEDKYDKGNLMPRDITSREEYLQMLQGKQVYLDMSHLSKDIYETRLKGVISDCIHFLGLDPRKQPIPVIPGIHYFMGGIYVDVHHRTSMKYLYAAGECACQYHGANRLGGNSLLGALYGGKVAALSAMEDDYTLETPQDNVSDTTVKEDKAGSYVDYWKELQNILKQGLVIIRDEETIKSAIDSIDLLLEQVSTTYDSTASLSENQSLRDCSLLGKAMLLSALERKESRGAHYRSDYPSESHEYTKQTIANFNNGKIHIYFQKAGESL